MAVEEVRKGKDEAKAAIAHVLQKFDEDTNIGITKIEVMRQLAARNNPSKIIGVLMEVRLYSK